MCLRGTIFLYQGDELGLPQAHIPFEKLKDPEGIRFWPDSLGRDGCRTPIPWQAGKPNAGFSTAEPWLPVDPAHARLAIDIQESDPASTLAHARHFIAFRKAHPALRLGELDFLDTPEPVLAFRRRYKNEELVCIFNLGNDYQRCALPSGAGSPLSYGLDGKVEGDEAVLPPWGGVVLSS